jgi:hypothetical protein
MTTKPDMPDPIPFQETVDYAIALAKTDGEHTITFQTPHLMGKAVDKITAYCKKKGFAVEQGASKKSIKIVRLQ